VKTEVVKCKPKLKTRDVLFVGTYEELVGLIGEAPTVRLVSGHYRATYTSRGWRVIFMSKYSSPDLLRGMHIDLAYWDDADISTDLREEILIRLASSNGSRLLFEEEI
jgi:hypothetical protein